MAELQQEKRQLSIKTGVVRRLSKEYWMYKQEAKEQELVVEKYVAEHRESHEIRKQEEILKDCSQMVPDTRRRLADGISDLDADAAKDTDEYRAAVQALETAKNDE
ncbi:hypothetical protein MBRA1_003039 [Malassezia brasiliensis]|uniref:Tubulin-specific chaperone A n=1 Tax=Malassezia brasiliensis TaxID=1821822 RepID=A0AAF0DW14_9BASI|nr:hypothetical protein MBRA1_003039 [Malassezia brasiliensis]